MDAKVLYSGSESDGEILTDRSFGLSNRLLALLTDEMRGKHALPWIEEMLEEEDMTFYPSESRLLLDELKSLGRKYPANAELEELTRFVAASLLKDKTIYVWLD